MRCTFLGSPPFAVPVLEALLESGHVLSGLVTRPDKPRGRGRKVEASPLVELARARDVPVLQPATTKTPDFVEALRAQEPDVLLVASYGEILREDVLELAPHGALNVHASLLPRHRGASPIQAAIAAGDSRTGISIQRMVLALDEGDVLLAKELEIGAEETAGELFARLATLGGEATAEALDLVEAGRASYTPQDPALATYAPRLRKADGHVDWHRPAQELARHLRAMTPWPGARACTADGKPLVLLRARVVEAPVFEAGRGKPGELLEVAERCVVACGEGALELLEVQPAGKRAMEAASWLRGARLATGARLQGGGAGA